MVDNSSPQDDLSGAEQRAENAPTYLDLYKNEIPPQTEHPVRDRPKWTDVAIVALTVGIVILAGLQWREMVGAGEYARRQTQAAEKIQGAAGDFSTSVSHLETIVGNAQGNMQTMAESSNNSIEVAQEAARLDERAWLAPISGTVTLDESRPLLANLMYQNVGKTPALQVMTIMSWKTTPAGQPINLEYPSPLIPTYAGTVYPGGKASIIAKNPATPSKVQIDAIRSGKMIFYVFGSIDYKDVFGRKHTSHFCNIASADLSTMDPCKVNNEAD